MTDNVDYFNLHFTTIADKVTRHMPTANVCSPEKLKQFVTERLPSGSQFTLSPITAEMVKTYLKFQRIKQQESMESVVLPCA